MAGTVTMYSTTWCGYCRRLKGQMDREGIAYKEINIEQDPDSAAFVEKANGGNQTVPTVLFEDGVRVRWRWRILARARHLREEWGVRCWCHPAMLPGPPRRTSRLSTAAQHWSY